MNDELKQNNWQEQSVKEMIQKNEEMGEILKHQLDIIEYEKAVDSDLVAFARSHANSDNSIFCKYEIGKVSERPAKEKTAVLQLSVEEGDQPYVPKPRRDVQNALTTSSTKSIPQTPKKVKKKIKIKTKI